MPIYKTMLYPPMFGSGRDGSLSFNGASTVLGMVPVSNVYTMVADFFATDINVASGVTIKTVGFIPYWTGTLTGSGRITFGANNASGATVGASFSAVGTLGTTTGAAGAGRSTTGAGSAASGAGSNNVAGSSSGAGGQADAGNAGGAGNTTASPTATMGTINEVGFLLRRRVVSTFTANGTGGGGGGGCNVGTGTATSGAGGGPAGTIVVSGAVWDWTGTLDANGGNGGNATTTGNGAAGGGGGGGAGAVYYVAKKIIRAGTITSTGGTGGTGAGGGSSGASASSGTIYSFIFS